MGFAMQGGREIKIAFVTKTRMNVLVFSLNSLDLPFRRLRQFHWLANFLVNAQNELKNISH